MTWFKELFGTEEKARAYIVIKWQVFEGAFHFFAERCVRKAGLLGWLRVVKHPLYEYMEIEVEGSKTRIDRLIEDLRRGPANSKATGIEVSWKPYERAKYRDFRIRV